MTTLNVKQLGSHRDGCSALREVSAGRWWSPWFLNGETMYRDSSGGRRGSGTRWLVCACNDIDCAAKAIVRGCDIERVIHEALSKGK